MSGPERENDGAKAPPTPVSPAGPAESPSTSRPGSSARRGFATMPSELRAFQASDPNKGTLAEGGVTEAAEQLRDAGRGPDVLFEDLRAEGPRDPSEPEARAEHIVIEMPGGASPWAKDAASAKAMAEVMIDRGALPSSVVPATRALVSSRDVGSASRGVVAGADSSRSRADGDRGRPARPIVPMVATVMIGAVLAVGIALAVSRSDSPGGEGSAPSGHIASSRGSATAANAGASAPATTEPAPMVTAAASTSSVETPTHAPALTATPSVGDAASSMRTAPRSTGEPVVDAGALPSATAASSAPPDLPPEPTTKPSTTTAPLDPFKKPVYED